MYRVTAETHALARKKAAEMDKIRNAFGLDADAKEGQAFDRDLQEQLKQDRQVAREKERKKKEKEARRRKKDQAKAEKKAKKKEKKAKQEALEKIKVSLSTIKPSLAYTV